MSVPALTTQYGHFQHYVDRDRPFTGTQGDGSPIDWSYPVSRHCGESVRKAPDKSRVHILGTNVKAPKNYLRIATRVVEDKPFVVREGGYDDSYSRNIGYFLSGSVEPRLPPNASELINNHYAASATRALNKLKSKDQLELGVDALEGRKTLQMIARPTIQVVSALLAAKRGRWNEVPDILGINRGLLTGKTEADLWLQYQYGWKPLMGSIHSAANLLKRGFLGGLPIYWVKSTSRDTYDYTFPYDGFNDVHLTGTLGVKTQIYYAIANATANFVESLGITNPLSIAWELVPFSFVADWFVPIGDCLSALTSTSGLEFRAGFTTEFRDTRERITYDSRPEADPHRQLTVGGSWDSESFFLSRRTLSSFPRPQLYANAHPWSSTRVSNAIALIRQLF